MKDKQKVYLFGELKKSEVWAFVLKEIKDMEKKKRTEHNYMSRNGHASASAHCAGFLEALEWLSSLPDRAVRSNAPSALEDTVKGISDRFRSIQESLIDRFSPFGRE